MQRSALKQIFSQELPVVLPVIHVLDEEQAIRNVQIAKDGGCKGIFLINHDFGVEEFLPSVVSVRREFPDYWIGLNFLAVTGKDAFPILAKLQADGVRIDGYWADDARIDESRTIDDQPEASEITSILKKCGWKGLYLGGTAFKKQREVEAANYAKSAAIACHYMDVVMTSGVATGKSADLEKIETFRKACAETALGLASGITPGNIHEYCELVDCILVATGINFEDDFYNINPERLAQLLCAIKRGESQ